MQKQTFVSRRVAVKTSLFGMLAVPLSGVLYAQDMAPVTETEQPGDERDRRYPAIAEGIVADVVTVAHFDLDRLKALVNARPELARATWDWGFGDWETAIGAASHVGRKDIVAYLLSMGARPDLFTFAMLGSYAVVRAMIESSPGLQRTAGPHGISLLQHVKNGLSGENGSKDAQSLVRYLEALGDADGPQYAVLEEEEKGQYLGDYKYGEGEEEGFSVKLGMRKLMTLGKIGRTGGALYKTGENRFTYGGAPSVVISFRVENGTAVSLTLAEPGLTLTAKKV